MSQQEVRKGVTSRTALRPQSLLERLRRDDTGEDVPSADAAEMRVRSIKNSLVQLLNSRRGGADSAAAYGLSDFNDASVGSSDMLSIICRDIRSTIEKYEPRVGDVRVQPDPMSAGGLELGFTISMRTRVRNKDEKVMIDLILREGRNFSLR